MSEEIEKLKQEVAELREKLEYTDDWAAGVLLTLEAVLTPLIKQSADKEAVRKSLEMMCGLYERSLHSQDEDDLSSAHYEPGQLLYRRLEIAGVWKNKP